MCGISGFYKSHGNFTSRKDTCETFLHKMNQSQKHRGPDADGIYLDDSCGLAHVRLSILDLAKGSQPMHFHTEGEDFVLVYNGEIYNMPLLRKDLQ